MAVCPRPMLALLCTIVWLLPPAFGEILTPPYFNLASGKRITATATCGDEGPELYCKLVGANADNEEHVIQGQVCDICDKNTPSKAHPPEYAVDGMETRWQSPPLSRGMKYNEVNLTIDLGQEFHVAYVYIRMGNSPRPGLWALEKSMDYGKTFVPWQYFSDSPQDCERYFGKESLQPITKDDSVICSTEYSKIVPLEGGEIPISLLKYRPSANRYFYSSVLQEWTRATNVRLRLIKTKNLLGHLMSVARQDPTVTRRYFYSIKDISIGGRCMCNGHAENCAPDDPKLESNILVCRCQHNTCGPQCAQCCPGFEQKKWRISKVEDRFACEPCNCHNHTNECTYDAEVDEKHLSLDIFGKYEGGGVCQNCQHNTEGINCNKCKSTYYKPYNREWHEIDVCQPCNCDNHFSTGNCKEEGRRKMCECRKEFNPPHCDSCAYGYFDYPNCKPCTCNLNGTEDNHCTPTEGMCPCKYNYAGRTCETCADGYYSPQCKNCECNNIGSVSPICDKESGNCTCKSKYSGRTCNQCQAGYYNYPGCSPCNCDSSGTVPSICDDVSGECKCKEGFGGSRCDQCISGFYMEVRGREKVCIPCNCSATGSTSTSCTASGKCNCLTNFGGKQCDQCSPGYYKYPECLSCNCDLAGSIGSSCDDNGQCLCRPNFDGIQCDHCKEHFYNYPACEECNCDPRGVIATFAGCGSVPAGELCQCKDRVQGRICNDCKPLFWNLQEYNPQGCEECGCSLAGTIGGLGTCNTKTGQCNCKPHVWESKCDQCADGFYRLEKNDMFGCTACDCDIGGAVDNNCNKQTGQCRCHSRVEGRRCDRPIQAHYFPTLHQFQYEVEEGRTQSGQVRYRSSEEIFPGYSWKGYVVFNIVQNEVINIVQITKSSLYRMVLRYVNPLKDPVFATIVITPENVGDTHQTFTVIFKPTTSPQFVTVSGEKGNSPAPFVMNPGNWTVTIKTTKEVLIDYFVLMPEPYYEARVLTKMVDKPCVIGDTQLCRLYAYPRLNGRAAADVANLAGPVSAFIDDEEQLKELNAGSRDIPVINNDQSDLQYHLKIDTNGSYYVLVEYVTPIDRNAVIPTDSTEEQNYLNRTYDFSGKGSLTVKFQSGDEAPEYALLYLPDCPYLTPCRQIMVDDVSKIQPVDVHSSSNTIVLEGESDTVAGIKSIVLIPESEWHIDYITPKPYCLQKDGQCKPAIFSKDSPISSKKIEIESGIGGDRDARPPILDNSTKVVYLGASVPELKLESKVPSPGEYMFVVHYFQPSHPESTVDVTVTTDNQKFEASLPIEHCPSNSGCRTLLQHADVSNRFPITENFTLTFNGEVSGGVWLDYVLVVSSDVYANSVLKDSNVLDFTRDFISNCALNHYYIGTNETGFCRDSIFSITSEYNSGALQCYCQYEGSTDLECEKFGGQCRCKPNVIGRTCGACRTGYYGYPDCRPCNCPSTAICNDYGECICPPNVEGPNCDRCKPNTFNFDVLHGCDDCNCNRLGVIHGQLQCDRDNGSCACQQFVMGRTCDHCVPGHYSFPYCQPCDCNLAGTTADVCDQNTAQCYCKKHTKGQACDTCKEEYYNLQADNPDGCTKCYCFGKTTRCASSRFVWEQIYGMDDWYLVNIDLNDTINIVQHQIPPTMLNETTIAADLLVDIANEKVVYFGTPTHYLGERLTTYGGLLRYTIFYTVGLFGEAISAADVILGGPNGFIFHHSIEQPPAVTEWSHSVRLVEDEFINFDGSPVNRDQFMNTLIKLNAIYIRATYWEYAVKTRLHAVSLEVAVDGYGNDEWNVISSNRSASSVEVCSCPPGYRGLSCEHCAQGHYRLSTGTHAGSCVQCQCNGHSNTCDVNTGVCLNCEHNTMGDHCEQCVPGYHGDATFGTQNDCLICACPLPVISNNFAVGCELSRNGSLISCDCLPGYGGPRCHFCEAGYYGKPEELGNSCKPCDCSGNINVKDPGSCDSITGSCLKCANNTSGPACNMCAAGFYGDAIFEKNCTPCDCDEFGMQHCDPRTGTCVCRPGVIGDRCDRCQPDYYGLSSGSGCKPCDCGLASDATQCDDDSGQCKCAKGVTGRRCDMCAAGYWNYTQDGCDHCNCNTGYSVGFMCNTQTGQCKCLPDVVGEKCDRCPDRWVLIPHEGCIECDSCTDALLYSIQDLSDWLKNETRDFEDKADSYFTTQRLNYISNQIHSLQPRVVSLKRLDFYDVTSAVDGLENSAKNSLRSAEFAATDSEEQIARAATLAAAVVDELHKSKAGGQLARDAVRQVANLASGLELSQQPRAESALAEARQIHSDIAEKDLQPKHVIAHSLYVNSTQQIERMNVFVQPVLDQSKEFESIRNNTQGLGNKLEEMLKYTDLSEHTATIAENLSANNRQSKFNDKIQSVSKLHDAAKEDLKEAALLIANVDIIHSSYKGLSANASRALEDIDRARNNIEERIKLIDSDIPELIHLRNEAERHVAALGSRALSLKQLAERESNNSRTQDAYAAASAYSSIVQEIKDAKKAAEDAERALIKAAEINKEIKDRVDPSFERSVILNQKAEKSHRDVTYDLSPGLKRAEIALTTATDTLSKADGDIYAIQASMPTRNTFTLDDQMDKADRVNSTVKNTFEIMAKMGGGLGVDKTHAQSLPKIADDTLKKISNIRNYIDSINTMTPNMTTTFNSVEDKQKELEFKKKAADDKLQKLRELIEQARAVANQINVGVDFDSTSTLQPRLPDTVDEMSTSTQVSTYFRTTNKNGMLLYLGNPKNTNLRRTKSDDFMVLEIQNGYPYLVMDIGDSLESGREPARINSDKYVADDKWYQVIVNRVGRNVKLTIRESLDDGTDKLHVNEATLPGQHTIFNLDREKSKLYVGGAPAGHGLQGITYRAFDGQIEELMIGDTPVGLWNFEKAENIRGARQRDKLTSSQSGPIEQRFNGRGHVTMAARGYVHTQKNNILLFFRTYAPDGLIYLLGEKDSFFSVQMQDGRVYLQICLGDPGNLLILGTLKKYNDGKWHKLDAKRYQKEGVLIIDNDPPIKGETSAPETNLRNIETMNFGGNNNGILQVTTKGFDGCLKQIAIDRLNVDLTENVEAIGVTAGCQFASLVSFSGGNGFLRYDNITADGFQTTLKFKTSEPDGLLFVYLSRQQTINSDSISLSLDKGKLVLMSQNERLDTGVYTYNDSNWHVVTVTHNTKQLSMVVDDFDKFGTDTSPAALYILDGVLFVGGVQPGYVLTVKIGNKTPFVGCIGDTTINGIVLNLLEPHSNQTITFGRCGSTTTTGGVYPESSWTGSRQPSGGSSDEVEPLTLAPIHHPATTIAPQTTTKVFPMGRDKKPTTPSTLQSTPVPPRVKPIPARPKLRPPPVPESGCALAFDPEYLIGGPTEGYRFGSRNDSRIEFDRLPGRQHDGFDLSLSLRTFDTDGGLIFYASTDDTHDKYLALYMKEGQLNLRMNCGGSPIHVISSFKYNDTLWHNVTVSRDPKDRCKLSADNQFVGEGVGMCDDKMTLQPPFYYGGLYQLTAAIKNNLNNFYKPFMGCLKQLTMNGQPVTEIRRRQAALQCTDEVEDGVYFAPPGGYLKLRKNFKVGREISISMEIKPRNSSGLLLSVHGKRDFMVLELKDNEVIVNVENGKGPFQASFRLNNKYSLCDGNWHRVIAVKSNHVVTVGVDGHFSNPALGSSSSTDTKSAIYIGGHERRLSLLPGAQSKTGYSGCIRKISISNENQDTFIPIPNTAAYGNVHVGVCPKN